MKHFFLFVIIWGAVAGAAAQQPATDSLRTVVLQEVQLTAKQKAQHQRLFHFFNANKAATTEDILSRIPEVSLIRRGSYGMEPVIRSFNANQINVLLDGMRIHGACTDRMDPVTIYIEPQNLQSMELRTGGGALMNGSSVGGSINMKLTEATCHEEKKFSGSFSSGYHSVAGAVNEQLRLAYSAPKWALNASGTYRKSGAYTDGSGKKVSYSQYEKINYALNAKFRLNSDAYIRTDYLADDGWNIGYPALPMDVGYAAARIGSIALVRESSLRRWQKWEAKMYANRIKHYMDDTHRPNVAMHMDMPGESATAGFYAEGSRRLSSKQYITLRADAAVTLLKASMTMYQAGQPPMYMLTWPDNRQVQSGVAAQYYWQIDSSLQLQANARADIAHYSLTSSMGKDQLAVFGYTETDSRFFIPSAGLQLSKKWTQKFKTALSLNRNGRAPTASELYGFYLFSQFDGYDYVGNPALQQERGTQAELSCSWQAPKLKAQLTAFASRVQHYIIGEYVPTLSVMTPGAKGVKVYRNTDHANLAGGEASVVYTPFLQTQIVSTLKYTYGEDEGGEPLPLIAPLRHVSSVRQGFGRFWLQAEVEAAAAQTRVSTAAQEKNTGAFSLWHLRCGYTAVNEKFPWRLTAGVENLLDAYYREHLDWGSIARPGRNFYAQLTVAF